jgi:alpha-beta hydrolase superfamily lysophospholipase
VLYYLGQAGQGLTDILECLSAAGQIADDDEASWFSAWLALARRVQARSEEHLAKGHKQSAGTSLLRASNYYRAALIHYAQPKDPVLLEATALSDATFHRALELLGVSARAVKIPYEATELPGTFFTSPRATGKAATLIVHQGFHAFPEETMWVVQGATARGYHCLLFHGPGQGLVLRQQALPFRPDWEHVVTPVVDFALTLPEVDPSRLVLKGLSFGGGLAPRAAAFESRLAAVVANPGILSWDRAIRSWLSEFPGLESLATMSPETFDAAVGVITSGDATPRWWFNDAIWKLGASSPSDMLAKMRAFNNEDIVGQIRCKVLVMDGTAEDMTAGEAQRLYDALSTDKTYMLFDENDTGLLHCHSGGLLVAQERMFDWLDEHV